MGTLERKDGQRVGPGYQECSALVRGSEQVSTQVPGLALLLLGEPWKGRKINPVLAGRGCEQAVDRAAGGREV